jgi:hypothetical protein
LYEHDKESNKQNKHDSEKSVVMHRGRKRKKYIHIEPENQDGIDVERIAQSFQD